MGTRTWLLSLAAIVLGASPATAEPSLGEAKKHVAKKNLISCKFTDKGSKRDIGAFTSRSGHRYGPTKAWWRRNLQCMYKAPGIEGAPNAKLKLEGSMWWAMVGGSFVYDSWDSWNSYDGIPAPTDAEIEALVRNDIHFGAFSNSSRITAITKVTIAANPEWWWETPNQLKVNIVWELDERDGDSLVSQRVTPQIQLHRTAIGQPWKLRSMGPVRPEQVASRKLTSDEKKLLLPLVKAEANRKAQEKLAALPKVEIPAFASKTEAVAFTFKMLRETDARTLEAYLRQVLSDGYKEPGTAMLISSGEVLIEKAVKAAYGDGARVKEQYCVNPLPDLKDSKYYNKDESSFTRLTFVREGGEFRDGKKVNEQLKIEALEVWLASGDELARLRSYSKDLCMIGLPKAGGQGEWKRGDRVRVQRGSAYPGVIHRIRDGQAQIITDLGDVYWAGPDTILEP